MKSYNNSGNFSAPCLNMTPVHDLFSSVFFMFFFFLYDSLFFVSRSHCIIVKRWNRRKGNSNSLRVSDEGIYFRYIYFSRPIRKSENLTRCMSYLSVGPVQKPTAVLFNTDEGNFFPRKNNNNNNKDFRENVARIISDM